MAMHLSKSPKLRFSAVKACMPILLNFTGCSITSEPLPSWLNRATRTIGLPTQDQCNAARMASVDLQQSAAFIETELEAAEDYLFFLKTTRQKTLEDLNRYRSLLAPIRRLPPEVLLDIFSACVDDTKLCNPLDFRAPPWLLGRVCRSWKTLVDSSPRLWSRIHLELGHLSPLDPEPIQVVKAFVQRAGHHPFQLDIDFSYHESHPMIELITAYAPQWEDVSLTLMKASTWVALSSIRNRLPALRRLRLQLGYIWTSTAPSSPTIPSDLFVLAPNLQRLEIDPYDALRLPWGQIRYLTCHLRHAADAWHILAVTSNSVECDISLVVNKRPIIPPPSAVRLPLGHSMTLRDSCDILQHLDMPCIKEIWMVNIRMSPAHWNPELHFHSLRTVGFIHVSLSDEAINQLLSMLPSVAHLITDMASANSVFLALAYQSPRSTVLPNLQHIVLSGRFSEQVIGPLLSLLRSRGRIHAGSRGPTAALRTFTFAQTDLTAPQIQDRIRGYFGRGLRVRCNEDWIETDGDDEDPGGVA